MKSVRIFLFLAWFTGLLFLTFSSAKAQTADGLRVGQIDTLYANPATRDSLLSLPYSTSGWDTLKATFVIKGSLVTHIIANLPTRDGSAERNLMYQIRKQNPGKAFDTSKFFTLTPTFNLTSKAYLSIGSAQERLTSEKNDRIKEVMVPSLRQYPTLYLHILRIMARNRRESDEVSGYGAKLILDIEL